MVEKTPPLSDLPHEWANVIREEWHGRTVFGKLLFPGWLVASALLWVVVLSLLVLVRYLLALENGPNILPEVHKDER